MENDFEKLQREVEELKAEVEELRLIAGDQSGGSNFLKDNNTGLQVFKGKVQFLTDVYNASGTKVIN